MLVKAQQAIALSLELVLYVACCFLEYLRPDLFVYRHEGYYAIDMATGLILAGASIAVVSVQSSRIFHTKRQQIEQLNQELSIRNETLEQYDRMKSDFLAAVAHELNTPLAVIAASSNDTLDLLETTPLDVSEIAENQKTIEKRVMLIDRILLDLMDATAIENGRITLRRQPMYLPDMLSRICSVQYWRNNAGNNTIEYEIYDEVPYIWADQHRIEQVITNLLSNAIMHTKNGTIKVSLMRLGGEQVISVADTGEGMEPEMLRTALEQFASSKADYWRHGIGLYICRCIVVAHGGSIWIESEKGVGTTVSISLVEEEPADE